MNKWKTAFLAAGCVALVSALAFADDDKIFDNSAATGAEVTSAAVRTPEFKKQLADQIKTVAIDSDLPVRVKKNKSLDFRVTAPEGLGVGFGYTPIAPITVAVSLNSMLGATVSATGEVQFNLMWPKQWTKNCSLTATARISHIILTGVADDVAQQMVKQIYGSEFVVDFAGRNIDAGAALGGVDCVFDGGIHVFAKAGYIHQIGSSYGGDNSRSQIILENWSGPTGDLGIGWAF